MAKRAEDSAKRTRTTTKSSAGRPVGRPKKAATLYRKDFVRMYEMATFPAFLVDRDLRIDCPNQAARTLLPTDELPNGLGSILPDERAVECLDRVRRGEHFHLDAPLGGLQVGLEFVPISEDEGGKIDGAKVIVTSLRGRVSLGEDATSPGSLRSLARDLRDITHSIFARLSLLYQRIPIDSLRSCEALLRELNLMTYQLLRISNNFSSYQTGLSSPGPAPVVVSFWHKLSYFLEPSAVAFRGSTVPFLIQIPDLTEKPAHVACRFEEIELALTNLLRNAFLYTRDGNRVTLSGRTVPGTEDAPSRVEVVISDLGRGISPELMNSVFLPFLAQGESGGDFPEIGLGLRVTRLLILNNGGSITMESTAGEGTTVTLSFPITDSPISDTLEEPRSPRPDRFSTFYVVLSDIVTNLPL